MSARQRGSRLKQAKYVLHEFANASSCHGIPRIIQGSTFFSKLVWAVITIGAFVAFTVGSFLLVRSFFEYLSTSKVDVKGRDIINFPQITLCNMNMLRRSKLSETEYKELISIDDRKPDEFVFEDENVITDDLDYMDYSLDSSDPLDERRTRRDIAEEDILNDKSIPDFSSEIYGKMNYFIADYESFRARITQNESHVSEQNWTKIIDLYNENKMDSWGEKVHANQEEFAKLGHQAEDFILQCLYNRRPCSYRDFQKSFVPGVGNCYTYNNAVNESYPVKKTRKRGTKSGLQLTLNLEVSEYLGFLSPETGVRVSIHAPYIQSFPDVDGIIVAPGFSTMIGIRQSTFIRLPEPYGDCENGRRIHGYHYSTMACHDGCLDFFVMKECGCHQSELHGTPICNPKDYRQRVCKSFIRSVHFDVLRSLCNCPKPCNETTYRKTVSTSAFPSKPFEPHLLEMLRLKNPKLLKYINDRATIRENLVRLKIFFEELSLEQVDQIPLFTEKNLLSQVGGMMGLFIGLSVITLFEFLHLFKSLIGVFLRKGTKVQSYQSDTNFSNL